MKSIGIDIGGTNIKTGVVMPGGKISDLTSIQTNSWKKSGSFTDELIKFLRSYQKEDIIGFGIAIPGLLTADRKTVFDVTAIPELDNCPLFRILSEEFPGRTICLENDANAAAWAEYTASENDHEDSLLLVTLGTGVGSGLVYNGNLFWGNGNALELGETISSNGEKLENRIGVEGILNIGKKKLAARRSSQLFALPDDLTIENIINSAQTGNSLSQSVLEETGVILGEALVNFIRLFDITHIKIGGGIAEGFNFIHKGIVAVAKQRLTEYYLRNLKIEKAKLANNAGLIGAGMLCFKSLSE